MPGADDFSQHAWLILSRALEASGVTSIIDSNANLEILLATPST